MDFMMNETFIQLRTNSMKSYNYMLNHGLCHNDSYNCKKSKMRHMVQTK
jgi:hypothetical protein